MLSLLELDFRPDAILPAAGAVRNIAENHTVYSSGEPADAILRVVSGVVRTCRFMSNGRRQIDAFHGHGDVFGFEAAAQYSLSAEAVSDCTLVSYRRRALMSLAAQHQGLANQLYIHSILNLARAREHSYLLGRSSAIEKLAAFLADAAALSPGRDCITLRMNRADIADYLGLTVETVCRSLARLREARMIEFSTPREIKLKDLDGLRMLHA